MVRRQLLIGFIEAHGKGFTVRKRGIGIGKFGVEAGV